MRVSDISPGALYCLVMHRHQWEVAPNPPYKRSGVFASKGNTPATMVTEVCASCGSRRFTQFNVTWETVNHRAYEYTADYRLALDENLSSGERRALYYRKMKRNSGGRPAPTKPSVIRQRQLTGPLEANTE